MERLTDWPWQHWATIRPDVQALVLDNQVFSWHQLAHQVTTLAANFQHQGVKIGTGVALWGKNSGRLLLAYLALLQCGARLLPLNPMLPRQRLAQLLAPLTIDFAFGPDELPVLAQEITPLSFSQAEGVNFTPVAWDSERLATLTLTSGSSGLPKAAAHNYAGHLSCAKAVAKLTDFQAQDSWLLSLPLYHVSGQGIVWRWLYQGSKLVLRPNLPLADALVGCTHASLVPTQMQRLLASVTSGLTLKAVLLGGAMIPPTLIAQAQQAGINCWCGYGLTELASTVCAKRADDKPGVGVPLPEREIQLVNEEIWLRAPSLALGYWHNGALIPLCDQQGWFHTRDRGVFRQGELCLLGRIDNLFFSGGEGVQPEDVEQVLATHPKVKQVIVVPIEDKEFGHRPAALVESDDVLTLTELLEWAKGKLARYQLPVLLLPLPQECKNSGIKISRHYLTQWLAQQHIDL